MTEKMQLLQQDLRDALASRGSLLAIALVLLVLGGYPGPSMFVLLNPEWRSDSVVTQARNQSSFWIAGAVLIIGPAIVFPQLLPRAFDRLLAAITIRLDRIRPSRFAIAAGLFAAGAAVAFALLVLSAKPTTSDEVAQLWQARILLTGRLALPPDPNPEFFAVDNIIDAGRWYSQFPIGGPALLAIGAALRTTWLVNPVLAGLTAINVSRFAERAFGAGEARLSALLCATCPFIAMMSGSYMNHTVVAFLLTLALAQMPTWIEEATRLRLRPSIVIGVSLGAAIAVRPLDGAVAVLVFGLFLLIHTVRSRNPLPLLVVGAAAAVPVALLLATNSLTTGHPLLFGYEVLWGHNHSVGFHPDPTGKLHTPARGLSLAALYLMQLNWSLFEWPIPGLLIVAAAIVVLPRLDRWNALLIGWIGIQLAAYAAYWHAGSFYGPRYLFTVVPAVLVVTARGLILVWRAASQPIRRGLLTAFAASVLFSWLVPAEQVGSIGKSISLVSLRSAFKVDVAPAIEGLNGEKALVFVSETASGRLMRRLWGLGVSRGEAARLTTTKDGCGLLEAAIDESQRGDNASQRLDRLEGVANYTPPVGFKLQMPDPAFRVSNRESVTPRCDADLRSDLTAGQAIAYGPILLLNQIGADGRIAGPVVFVADLREHNEVLRQRFGDRAWYRLQLTAGENDRVPRLVPYR